MNSKQQIMQQENDLIDKLIDQVETTFANFKAAANLWEADTTAANATAMEAALEAHKAAKDKLASRISSLRRVGYKIIIEWDE